MLISELCDHYKLNSRKSLYSRLDAVGIKLNKDESGKAYATAEEIEILDQLDRHLKAGGTLKNFVPPIDTTVELHTPQLTTQHGANAYGERVTSLATQHRQHTPLSAELLGDIIAKIIESFNSIEPRDPLDYMRILETAIEREWILSTSEIKRLIGVKPHTKKDEKTFTRGCFQFTKYGKIGAGTGWKVSKIKSE